MNCKDVEKYMVSGEELPFEAQVHLLHCKECQLFSEAYLLASGKNSGPSDECDRICRALPRRMESIRVHIFRRRIVSSVAAALVIACGVLTFLVIQQPENRVEAQIAYSEKDIQPECYDGAGWLLLANKDLEHLQLGAEDDKAPMKQLYAELASLEVDFYGFF